MKDGRYVFKPDRALTTVGSWYVDRITSVGVDNGVHPLWWPNSWMTPAAAVACAKRPTVRWFTGEIIIARRGTGYCRCYYCSLRGV